MESVLLQDILPCAALQSYVRKYQVYRFSFERSVKPPVKFHTPRPEHSLTFYVRDSQRFSNINSDLVNVYPPSVINGIYTVPLYRYGGYDFCAIKVVLQPTTLSNLKIVSVKELGNNYINAEDCFGSDISFLNEQLRQLNDIQSMICVIEMFLIHVTNKHKKSFETIDKVSQFLLSQDDSVSLDYLADQSCLSVRQFIRRFEDKVGLSPKMFQKIIRFDRAYRIRNDNPDKDWLYVALSSGYYDYQHLVRDFKEFTNLTPTAFYQIEKASPERYFSLHER